MIQNAIGIFGGSFNPVHLGHVRLAEEIQRACDFRPLWVVPSKNPPHKSAYEIGDAHRLAMARIAFAHLTHAQLSTFELESEGPSYAIRTIEYFIRQHPGNQIYFILGADAFNDLPSWYAFPDVMEACSYIVAARAGWDEQPTESEQSKLSRRLSQLTKAGLLRPAEQSDPKPFTRILLTRSGTRVCILDAALPEISSTEVRIRVQLGENVAGLVPPDVERYLKTNGLYGSQKA